MSSFANYPNNSASASILDSDNNDENESMMHKVKDVVSKFLHPSFLFSTSSDTDNPKRKRSTSDDEQPDTTNYRPIIRDDKPQLTDDEDRDVPSTEIDQQKKRRRTANYQNILSTKTTTDTNEDKRISSILTSTDSVRSLSNTRSTRFQTTFEENPNEGINRLTSSKQRFNIPSTYRGSTPNYDPSKSPLFSVGSREKRTTTNLKSNEFSANYLLATSLATQTQPSSILNSQQFSSTLSNPINNHKNRLLTNERSMLGSNYSSTNFRRLPYIERLRRRTLQDCIRLNRTVDSEPLSLSTIEEHQSTTTSPIPKRKKVPEKECGIQCDITTIDNSNKKIQRTFLSSDIQTETLSVPIVEKIDSSIQSNSSITIEKKQPPIIGITKPKVLGDVTPFSWPKFARAQEEYSKKYPEKCQADAASTKSIVPSVFDQSNVSIIPPVFQRANNSSAIPKIPIFTSVSSRPDKSTSETIWKCPSCTKEHPVQTASCSLCHGINPNYKRFSTIEPTLSTVTVEKEPVSKISSSKLPDVVAKEPNVTSTNQPIPIVSLPVTTKENISSLPPSITTDAPLTGRINFPVFSTTPFTSFPTTIKESPASTNTSFMSAAPPPFGTTSATTKESPASTNTSFMSTGPPSFRTTSVITKESPASTNPSFMSTAPPSSGTTSATTNESFATINPSFMSTAPPRFGTTPATIKESTVTTNPPFMSTSLPTFGITSTVSKENPVTTSASVISTASPLFGSSTLINSASNFFQTGAPVQTFGVLPSTSSTTAVDNSTVPSVSAMPPSTPTSPMTFGSIPTITITPATSAVQTISSDMPATTSSAPYLITSTSVNSNLFATPAITPTPTSTTTASFPVLSTASAFSIPSSFTFTSPTTASTSSSFGGSGGLSVPAFNFAFGSATTTPLTNPSFGFGASSTLRPTAPPNSSLTQPNTVPTFGSPAPFGVTSTSVPSFLPFGSSNAPLLFGFGSAPNTTTNTVQTSVAPPAFTSGFSLPPSGSTVPVFGAGPAPLSSVGPSNLFSFSGTPMGPTNNTSFQFTGATSTPTNNPFEPPASSDLVEEHNPFDAGNESSRMERRPPIRGIRRRRH